MSSPRTEPPAAMCPACDYPWSGLPPRGACPECGFAYDEGTHVIVGDTSTAGVLLGLVGGGIGVVVTWFIGVYPVSIAILVGMAAIAFLTLGPKRRRPTRLVVGEEGLAIRPGRGAIFTLPWDDELLWRAWRVPGGRRQIAVGIPAVRITAKDTAATRAAIDAIARRVPPDGATRPDAES